MNHSHHSSGSWILPVQAIGWGGGLFYWGISDQLNLFLNPSFRPWVLASGIGLILFGIGEAERPSQSCCEHQLTWKQWIPASLALLVILFCPREALSWNALSNRTSTHWTAPSSTPPPNTDPTSNEVIEVDLLDLATASVNPTLREALQGKTVSVAGQFISEGGPHLMRLIMWCCAADAQPLLISLPGLPVHPPEKGWIQVIGTLEIGEMGSEPILHPRETHLIPPPEDPYSY